MGGSAGWLAGFLLFGWLPSRCQVGLLRSTVSFARRVRPARVARRGVVAAVWQTGSQADLLCTSMGLQLSAAARNVTKLPCNDSLPGTVERPPSMLSVGWTRIAPPHSSPPFPISNHPSSPFSTACFLLPTCFSCLDTLRLHSRFPRHLSLFPMYPQYSVRVRLSPKKQVRKHITVAAQRVQ